MKSFLINLKDYYPRNLNHDVYLSCCLYDESFEMPIKRKGVLILPGGGYEFTSYREKDPIMFGFLKEGFNTFALSYSCHTAYPVPHVEVACAMHYINKRYKEFNLEPLTLSIVGFSAGGHLASSYGYLYKKLADNKTERKLLRPYSIVLGYPVTSVIRNRKNDKCVEIISRHDPKLLKLLETIKHIDKSYPPTFLWCTKTDKCVRYMHTVWLRNELNKHKVKNKCIIYSSGPHGLALANMATYGGDKNLLHEDASHWLEEASKFIYSIKGE